jgi:hypothetical protein
MPDSMSFDLPKLSPISIVPAGVHLVVSLELGAVAMKSRYQAAAG